MVGGQTVAVAEDSPAGSDVHKLIGRGHAAEGLVESESRGTQDRRTAVTRNVTGDRSGLLALPRRLATLRQRSPCRYRPLLAGLPGTAEMLKPGELFPLFCVA